MASLANNRRLIKNLTPAQVGRALGEWCLVNAGINLSGKVSVKVEYSFDHEALEFRSARVEVELPPVA